MHFFFVRGKSTNAIEINNQRAINVSYGRLTKASKTAVVWYIADAERPYLWHGKRLKFGASMKWGLKWDKVPTKDRNSSFRRREIDGVTASLAHRYPTDTPTLLSHHTPESTPFFSLKGSERSTGVPPLTSLTLRWHRNQPRPSTTKQLHPLPDLRRAISPTKGGDSLLWLPGVDTLH